MLVPHFTPRISLAVRSPRLARTAHVIAAAERTYIPQIDLDVTGRRFTDPESLRRALNDANVSVRAIWLPDRDEHAFGWSQSGLADRIGRLAIAVNPASIIVDRPTNRADVQQAQLLRDLRRSVPPETRVVYVIRPGALAGTRDHLADLTALRRNAEEWDLDLALDLHGPIDPKWEAEAAITKLRSRLTVVRFGPLPSHPPGRGRERATARVLATLADSLYEGVIAISPQVRPFRYPTVGALADSCAATATLIRARYGSVQAALPERVRRDLRYPNETRTDGPGWR